MGSCLLNIDRNTLSDFNLMNDYMLLQKPDIWISTPSVIRTCMYDETFIQNTKDYIKQFVFDGEILPKELAVSIFENYNTSKIV